ncbi:MAG: SIR2 family protein [bacterium]|nr:SIR2 family protein [bacterium]
MSSSTPITIAFLLGSGVSFPAGMASTQDITERVLSGEGVVRHTNENYYFGQPLYSHEGMPDQYVPRVLIFLRRLKIEIDLYYFHQIHRYTDYEDLHYLSSQIYDSETGEYDNPAVQPLIDKILSDIRPILVDKENEISREWQLHELAREATHYIRDVVWHLLSQEPSLDDHLGCIRDAILDDRLSKVDIFTLNQDTILEQFLSQTRVQVNDGFTEPVRNVRYWDPELFEKKPSKIRLFKLHGSVNWVRFRTASEDIIDESIGIPLDRDIWHTRNPQGQRQLPADGRPEILVGTFDKMLRYTSSIFADLHWQFNRSLRNTPILIVSGYGFRDKGINSQIVEWVYSSPDRKIILVEPKPERLKKGARGAMTNNWDELIRQNKLVIVQKGVEETSWQEIEGMFFDRKR